VQRLDAQTVRRIHVALDHELLVALEQAQDYDAAPVLLGVAMKALLGGRLAALLRAALATRAKSVFVGEIAHEVQLVSWRFAARLPTLVISVAFFWSIDVAVCRSLPRSAVASEPILVATCRRSAMS